MHNVLEEKFEAIRTAGHCLLSLWKLAVSQANEWQLLHLCIISPCSNFLLLSLLLAPALVRNRVPKFYSI